MRELMHGGNIRQAADRFGIDADKIIDFSASVNPLGMPMRARKALIKNLDILEFYPDTECKHIKESLSGYLRIPKENLLVGNGSIEIIFLIFMALRPKTVLIPIPTFGEYEKAASLFGAKRVFLKPTRGLSINKDELFKGIDSAQMVFICNPNNPTGSLIDYKTMSAIAERCKSKGVFLVVDEAFIDFLKNKWGGSLIRGVLKNERLLVIGSLTKFFAIAGLRLGYLAADSSIIGKISKFQSPWSVNAFAQLASTMILRDKNYINKSRRYIQKEKIFLFNELNKINFIKAYKPSANFIFCKITCPKISSGRLYEFCGKNAITIRDCSDFRGLDNTFIRVAVRKRQENKKLIRILKKALV